MLASSIQQRESAIIHVFPPSWTSPHLSPQPTPSGYYKFPTSYLFCCCCLVAKSCATPWTVARQASFPFNISWGLLKLTSIELVMPSNHLILCRPLLLLPSILPRNRILSNESAFPIRWPKFWSFSISPSNKYSELISFRTDCFDFLAVRGTLKSSPAPQFKSINSSVLSLLYGPTLTSIHDYWKNHSFDYMDLCQ